MKIRDTFRGLYIKAIAKRVVSKKQLISSYVSLFVVFAVLMTVTFSWFTVKNTASIDASTFTLSASSGLRVNQGDDMSGQVKLATDVRLAEASSVDGRNIYFPTTGTFTSTTSSMTFREGNVGDKNKWYYYNDFSLNTDSGKTDVYVKGYEVKVTTTAGKTYTYNGAENQEATVKCPIRIAFIKDSADAESIKVIDPTALLKEYSTTYQSVSSTNSIGEPIITESKSHSFMQYYYGNDPLFTLGDSGDLDMTMVIWLEGGDRSTGPNNCDEFVGATVSLNIQLESNWDYMEKIKFIDKTYNDNTQHYGEAGYENHWVTNGADNKPGVCIVTMSYLDTDGNYKYVEMKKSENYNTDYTWSAYIPIAVVQNITFNRYNPERQEVWNSWYTEKNVNTKFENQSRKDLQESRELTRSNGTKIRSLVYTATQGTGHGTDAAYNSYPSRGYWDYTGNDDCVILSGGTEETTEATTVEPSNTQPSSTDPSTSEPQTTAPPSGDISIGVSFADQTSTRWIYTNVTQNGCKLYIVFDNGTSYVIPNYSVNYFTGEGFIVDSTAKFKGFELRNSSGKTINTFYLDEPHEVQDKYNYNYYVNTSDKLIKQ